MVDVMTRVRAVSAADALSEEQVARMAGVPTSLFAALRSGAEDAVSSNALVRIRTALGLDEQWKKVSSPAAISAARWALGDGPRPDSADRWLEKWSRIELVGLARQGFPVRDARSLAFRAGRSAVLADRPGGVAVRQDRSWSAIAQGLAVCGVEYAGTGDRAANRLADSASEIMPTFYVPDPERAVELLSLSRKPEGEFGFPILLLPFDGFSEANRWQDEDGVWYATPWQVVMDCYAGPDRMPEQADQVLDSLLSEK